MDNFKTNLILTPNENLGRFQATSRSCDGARRNSDPGWGTWLVIAVCDLFGKGDGGGPSGSSGQSSTSTVGSFNFGSNGGYSGSANGDGGGGGGGSMNVGSLLGSQISNTLFTAAQLRTKFKSLGFTADEIDVILDNLPVKNKIIAYFQKRDPRWQENDIALAVRNNVSYADSDPDLLLKYLDLLINNDNYYADNYAQTFPSISVTILGKYLSAFTTSEFSDMYNDKPVFTQINDFLTSYSFNIEAIKVAKIQFNINWEDSNYLTESIASQSFPPLIVAWILKAGGETIIDAAIDVAFGYLTGCSPGVFDHLLSLGTNLIGTGEVAQALKVEKYLAKVLEIANKVRHIPGGNKLADNIIIAGDKFINTVLNLDLTNLRAAEAKLSGAFDNLLGHIYEARMAASIGNTIKGVAVRGADLANSLGISTNQLNDIARRLGRISNDIEIDILEEVGGKINLGECKLLEVTQPFFIINIENSYWHKLHWLRNFMLQQEKMSI